jgi:DNA helicase-2/ATP-dependent DNA helicase PcrA
LKFITDFHIHSHYSIATSKNLIPEYLEYFGRLKGINVIGTGDCVHPGWMRELKQKLEPCENGLFQLKKEFQLNESKALMDSTMPGPVYFMLTGEISSIYKKNDKVRKVHNVTVFPDFKSLEKVQQQLDAIGNITSDGRPILGLDSHDLLEMVLESGEESFLIPAHIWTPWFSVLGSKSGFDTIDECYEDLTEHIFALETGLSTDPPMNWACSFLDRFRLVSNSDAHSPEKLGREANLFDSELSYSGIYNALKNDDGFEGTIEFFPQEGKYHYDGHRKCGIKWDPLETLEHEGICPVCGRPVTRGVMYRIAQRADRSDILQAPSRKMFYSITQLPDLIAEICGVKSSKSASVQRQYYNLLQNLGTEFYTLLFAPIEDILHIGGEEISMAIDRLRRGDVSIEEGYDGEFGRVKIYGENDSLPTGGLFSYVQDASADFGKNTSEELSIKFDIARFQSLLTAGALKDDTVSPQEKPVKTVKPALKLSPLQEEAVNHRGSPCLVIAGPGSGKTRVLTERIRTIVDNEEIDAGSICAITFSNRAAHEISERLEARKTFGVKVSTFHALGLDILKENFSSFDRDESFSILDREECFEIALKIGEKKNHARRLQARLETLKQGMPLEEDKNIPQELLSRYDDILKEHNAFDINDLVYVPVLLLEENDEIARQWSEKFSHILIDEYQDINAVQYRFVQALAKENNENLFAIGDPDQAIYGFRGSDVRFIQSFTEDFPGAVTISLDRSYRCPHIVTTAGAQMLGRNSALQGRNASINIAIKKFQSDRSEADWIAGRIEELVGGVRSFSMNSGMTDGTADDETLGFSDFAVLCRSAFMFDHFLEAFDNHGIPCQAAGTDPFYVNDPHRRLLMELKAVYYDTESTVETEIHKKVDNIFRNKQPLSEAAKLLLDDILFSADEEERVMNFLNEWENDYTGFFRSLALRKGSDDLNRKVEAVSLMTLHASKGLEFRHVFIPGCEEGIIPFSIFGELTQEQKEEEERLFYVGLTRTLESCTCTHAERRAYKSRTLTPARSYLLDRIDPELLDFSERKGKPQAQEVQLELF